MQPSAARALTIRPRGTLKSRALNFTALGLGTAPLGNLYAPVAEADADGVLAAAWSAGIRHFDTAPLYGHGLAETRLNRFLRDKPRDSYTLSSKVGRLLQRVAPESLGTPTHYFATPSRKVVFNYGYDGVMRSIEHSLERLGVDRLDIVYAHDLGADTHGSRAASNERIAEFRGHNFGGGYRALDRLRGEGVIGAIGAGCNEWEACKRSLVWAISMCSCSLAATRCWSRARCNRFCRCAPRRASAW